MNEYFIFYNSECPKIEFEFLPALSPRPDILITYEIPQYYLYENKTEISDGEPAIDSLRIHFLLKEPLKEENQINSGKITKTRNETIGKEREIGTRNNTLIIDDDYEDIKETVDNTNISVTDPTTTSTPIKYFIPSININPSKIPKKIIGELNNQTIEIKIDFDNQLKNKTLKGQIQLIAKYVIKSSYDVTFDHNFGSCKTLKELDTSFFPCKNLEYRQLYGRYKSVQADQVCDKYNHCNDCDCNEWDCDCSAGSGTDEDEMLCRGQLKTATNLFLAFFVLFAVVGIIVFTTMRHHRTQVGAVVNYKNLIFSNDFKTITIELIENLKSISRKEGKCKTDHNWNRNQLFVRKLNELCTTSDYKKNIFNVLITLSQIPQFEKACYELFDILYIMECERLGDTKNALNSFMSYREKDSYVSEWIINVHERHGFSYQMKKKFYKKIKRILPADKHENKDSSDCLRFFTSILKMPINVVRNNCNFNTEIIKYYITLWMSFFSAFAQIGIFYFDLVKDGAALYFFYHLSYNILFLTGAETRYASVGEINFERLFYYLTSVVIISEIIIYLRVYWRRKDFPRLFDTKPSDNGMNLTIGIFPLHSVILEQLYIEFKIKEIHRQIVDTFQTTLDESEALIDNHIKFLRQVDELEHLKHRLFYLNQFLAEIEMIENTFERELQLVVQTTLFLLAIYYTRILLYFDELFGIPIRYVFALNWCWTIFSISKNTLRYRNAKRYPMTPSFTGWLLQLLTVMVFVSGKILFVSAALSSYPYLHPIGHCIKMIVIYLFYAAYTKCKTEDLFDAVISTATSACFFRFPASSTSEKSTNPRKETVKESDSCTESKGNGTNLSENEITVDGVDRASTSDSRCDSLSKRILTTKIFSRFGGIFCTLAIEIISGLIYTGLGFIIRRLRWDHKIKIDELTPKSAFDKKLLPLLETFFIDVNKIYLIIGITSVPITYLVLKLLYYQLGHPKKCLINMAGNKQKAQELRKNIDKLRREYPDLLSSTDEAGDNLIVENELKNSDTIDENLLDPKYQDVLALVEIPTDCSNTDSAEKQMVPPNADVFQQNETKNEDVRFVIDYIIDCLIENVIDQEICPKDG